MYSNQELGHYAVVARLRELLFVLFDDDELFPNAVGNLSIVRNGKMIGFINCLNGITVMEKFDDEAEVAL